MSDRWFELDAGSYLPLPFYPWPERPARLPLDVEEAATSLFLAHGDINRAAERLRVTPARLNKCIRKSPRLIRLQARLTDAPEFGRRGAPLSVLRDLDLALDNGTNPVIHVRTTPANSDHPLPLRDS